MSVTTTTTTNTTAGADRTVNKSGLGRLLQSLRVELRRALELAGAPYKDGLLPPL